MKPSKELYPKIDIYFMGKYDVSTNWSKTCKQAEANYAKAYGISQEFIKARFSK